MIISRTPFRVSFFGGGTDYPVWSSQFQGAVLSTTIDKYCYISCRYFPPFFEYKSIIVYSQIETVSSNDQIKHPAIREMLRHMDIKEGMEIHYAGDLPARTGIGSSSSFVVGFLNAIYALQNKMVTSENLAKEAIHIERNILKETVGSQDQVAAAFGGLNKIKFSGSDAFEVEPIVINRDRLATLESHLLLCYTSISRYAFEIAKKQVQNIPHKKKELVAMYEMVDEAISILTSNEDILHFGKLLDESWKIKKSLTDKLSTPKIDEIYQEALRAGAIGGKLLGAGGGGFLLLFARPEDQNKIKEKLKPFICVPFHFDYTGSQIIFSESVIK